MKILTLTLLIFSCPKHVIWQCEIVLKSLNNFKVFGGQKWHFNSGRFWSCARQLVLGRFLLISVAVHVQITDTENKLFIESAILTAWDKKESWWETPTSKQKAVILFWTRILADLLPACNNNERYNFRNRRMFSIPHVKTKRFGNTYNALCRWEKL